MTKGRLEAFSDGVIAIIITIMVLGIKIPEGDGFYALKSVLPAFLSYVLSFIYVGIYWNNHHHMLQSTQKVNGSILWANLHLLFWLSLIPLVTEWMGANHFAAATLGTYGFILLMTAVAYFILQHTIIKLNGRESILAKAIGKDNKGKLSALFYCIGIAISFISPLVSGLMYVLVAFLWLVPDKRIEKRI